MEHFPADLCALLTYNQEFSDLLTIPCSQKHRSTFSIPLVVERLKHISTFGFLAAKGLLKAAANLLKRSLFSSDGLFKLGCGRRSDLLYLFCMHACHSIRAGRRRFDRRVPAALGRRAAFPLDLQLSTEVIGDSLEVALQRSAALRALTQLLRRQDLFLQ